MKMKVKKTTFIEEQADKFEAWIKLSPLERLARALAVRQRMRKPGVNYSYDGQKVTVKKMS